MDYTVHGILQAWILERGAFPFSRDLPNPSDQTQVSHIAGGFLTSWATREALYLNKAGENMENKRWIKALFLEVDSVPVDLPPSVHQAEVINANGGQVGV